MPPQEHSALGTTAAPSGVLRSGADRIRRIAHSGKFAGNVATIAGGTLLGQLVVLAAAPLVTRLYTPSDFGVLGVYAAVLSLISVMACLRYEVAIPLPDDDADAATLVFLSLVLCVSIAGIAGGALMMFGGALTRWTNTEQLKPYLWLLPVGISTVGAYQALSYWAIRKRQFMTLGRTKIAHGVGLAVVQLVAGVIRIGPVGLLIADTVGRGSGITSLVRSASNDRLFAFRGEFRQRMPTLAKRYSKFPLLLNLSGFLNTAAQQVPTLLLAAYYGAGPAGWFVLVQRVMGAPTLLVGQSVSQVYVGAAAPLVRCDPSALRRLFLSTAKQLSLWIALPVMILMILAPEPFKWIFGARWATAGYILQALSLMYIANLVITPIAETLLLLERQEIQLYWDGARLLLAFTTLWAAGAAGLSIIAATAAYGTAMAIMYGAQFFLIWHELNRQQKRQQRIPE